MLIGTLSGIFYAQFSKALFLPALALGRRRSLRALDRLPPRALLEKAFRRGRAAAVGSTAGNPLRGGSGVRAGRLLARLQLAWTAMAGAALHLVPLEHSLAAVARAPGERLLPPSRSTQGCSRARSRPARTPDPPRRDCQRVDPNGGGATSTESPFQESFAAEGDQSTAKNGADREQRRQEQRLAVTGRRKYRSASRSTCLRFPVSVATDPAFEANASPSRYGSGKRGRLDQCDHQRRYT